MFKLRTQWNQTRDPACSLSGAHVRDTSQLMKMMMRKMLVLLILAIVSPSALCDPIDGEELDVFDNMV